MSRVGKVDLQLPQGVKIEQTDSLVSFVGPKGKQEVSLPPFLSIDREGEVLRVVNHEKSSQSLRMWGTVASLIRNAMTGAHVGFSRRLIVEGVGYRATIKGQQLVLNVGYSHEVVFTIPSDLAVVVVSERPVVLEVSGVSKQRVGQFSSEIRAVRRTEPYKGKGIRFSDEFVLRKEGKKK